MGASGGWHEIWRWILVDLPELAKDRLDVEAFTQESVAPRTRLVEHLQVIFQSTSREQCLKSVAKLADSYGLNVNNIMAADSAAVQSAPNLPTLPTSMTTKKKKGKGDNPGSSGSSSCWRSLARPQASASALSS